MDPDSLPKKKKPASKKVRLKRRTALKRWAKDSWVDFDEWLDAEGDDGKFPEPDERYAYVQATGAAGGYGWVAFVPDVESNVELPDDEWCPVAIVDLDTGEEWHPKLTWEKRT